MDYIEKFLMHLRAAGASDATIKTRKYYLKRFSRENDLLYAQTYDLERFIASHTWATETARSVRSTFTTFYKYLFDTGAIDINPAARLPVIHEKAPNPHPLPENEYAKLLQLVPDRWNPAVRLAGEAGLRRSEIARVSIMDLFEDLLGWSLIVHGKGGKERTVPLNDSLARELRVRMRKTYWLYPARSSSGHITEDYLAKRVRAYLPPQWSMHSLRHRFATIVYANTSDIRAVQELLGHANLNTTQRYVAMPKKRLRNAAITAAAA